MHNVMLSGPARKCKTVFIIFSLQADDRISLSQMLKVKYIHSKDVVASSAGVPGHTQFLEQVRVKTMKSDPVFYCGMYPRMLGHTHFPKQDYIPKH